MLAFDKDTEFLIRLKNKISDISDRVQYQYFCDEEQFLDRLYESNTEVDAVIISADTESTYGTSLASAIAERFRGIEIIFSVPACEVKDVEQLFLISTELRPLAVMVKPVEDEVLRAILSRIQEVKNKRRSILMVSSGRKYALCRASEIKMISSQKRKINLSTKTENISIYGQLKRIKEILPSYFLRPHASYLVNAYYIESIESDYIILRDGSKIPMSRGCRRDFIEEIKSINGIAAEKVTNN